MENGGFVEIINVLNLHPDKIVLSNKAVKDYKYKKIVFSKKVMKGKECYQIEKFTDKQAFHKNIEIEELEDEVLDAFPDDFIQMNVFAPSMQYDFKMSKKGKLLANKKKDNNLTAVKKIEVAGDKLEGNNRKKNYLIKEGTKVLPLVDLGIFTKDGRVVSSMYDKYKQINRFIEMIDDVLPEKDGPL